MKNFNGWITIVLVGLVVLLPGFSDSSWQDRACKKNGDCINFTEPFCIRDGVNNLDDAYYNIDQCIRAKNTSQLSESTKKDNVKEVISLYCSELL
jgi:hypothetical protein